MRNILLLFLATAVLAPAAGDSLSQRIRRLTGKFPGQVMLYARNLDTGASFGLNQDTPVRTASTIKLPILAATFAAVGQDRLRWTDPVALTEADKVGGAGVLTEFSPGVRIPLRDLANLMIVVSDNTATNLVLDQVTTTAVNHLMDRLGLHQTRSLRKINGPPIPGDLARYGIGVSTPREMVLLLEKLEKGEVVSPQASREMLDILERQQHRDGIARHLGETRVASKTGALDHLRSDVSLVYSKRGRIAIAITCENIPEIDYGPDNRGLLLISDLAAVLLDGLAETSAPPAAPKSHAR